MAIPPSYWNAKRQCISKTLPNEIGNCEELNNQLGRIRKIVEAIIEQGLATGAPNIGAYVKSLYKPGFTMDSLQTKTVVVPKSKKEPDFFGELDNYIQSKEKVVCEKGLVNFRTMKGRLLAFEESRKKKIMFSSLDYNFYLELVAFFTYDYQLRHVLKPEYGLKVSSIGKTVKQLRMFVKDRVCRKVISPVDMEDFKILEEETDAVYLTYEEIGKIYSVDLSDSPTLILYRDMFILGCLTGLRFSDYSTLKGADLRNGLLYKKTSKMDNRVVIPLRREAIDIFNKHYANGVPSISNMTFNKHIKEVLFDGTDRIEIIATTKRIKITGRNLGLLFDYLVAFRVRYIKMHTGSDFGVDDGGVGEIDIQELKLVNLTRRMKEISTILH